MTYTVRAQRWEHGLMLDVQGVGWTQTHDDYPQDTPEKMVRDSLSILGREDAHTAELVMIYD